MDKGKVIQNESSKNGGKKIIKGNSDWREYESKILENGVQCIFVNDRESKTTSMSVCVNAGAASDPRELSGLAHFTEHMCFLGSEKYPVENEFKQYLSQHGGKTNASTSLSATTYQFDVLSQYAEKAVDMFSHFFISPLFTESGTSREVNAVDSENSKNLINDGRRRLQIYKALADQTHYYSKFSTGHKDTLEKGNVREELLTYHMRHYRPSNMIVVIVGPQKIDTLRKWIVPIFENVIDKWEELDKSNLSKVQTLIDEAANDAPASKNPKYTPAFRADVQENRWPLLLTILPLKEQRKLYMSFPVPPVYAYPDNSPMHLISHLLGHEGKGSAFANLQNASYITALSSGYKLSAPDHCVFQISVSLTLEGEQKWKDVAKVIFDYCRMLHYVASIALANINSNELKDLQRIWHEVAEMCRISFDHVSPGSPYFFAPKLAHNVNDYGIEHSLSAGSMLKETPATLSIEKLAEYSSLLIPENCIFERSSKAAWQESNEFWSSNKTPPSCDFLGLQTEKWYGIDYYVSEIDKTDVIYWNDNKSVYTNENSSTLLHLPKSNPYIPKNLRLCDELPPEAHTPRIELTMRPPEIVVENEHGRLWHKLDERYALPKSILKILFRNPITHNSFKNGKWNYCLSNAVHTVILLKVFIDALAQETYDADLAGLSWNFSNSSYGLTLHCSGYSERIPDLTMYLLKQFFTRTKHDIQSCFLQEAFIISTKDQFIRAQKSYLNSSRADTYADHYLTLLLSTNDEDTPKIIEAIEQVTLKSLIKHYYEMTGYENTFIECLYSGNVSKGTASKLFSDVCACVLNAKEGSKSNTEKKSCYFPGPAYYYLQEGENIEIQFQSHNVEDENGAVLMTFQSCVPGFKGSNLSSPESLKRTAALRLICHILREPLFDELRTKQTLGYIVGSYFDLSCNTLRDDNDGSHSNFTTDVVEYICVKVLSNKTLPSDIKARIDRFLFEFRKILLEMPDSVIKDHSNALSTKLMKPIQKLSTEVDNQSAKIRRYAPEILHKRNKYRNSNDIPWDSTKDLAKEISTITRNDLVEAYDAVVVGKGRSRVVSCIYGRDYPISKEQFLSKWNPSVLSTVKSVMEKRKALSLNRKQVRYFMASRVMQHMLFPKKVGFTFMLIGAAAGLLGMGLFSLKRKELHLSLAKRKLA